MKLEAMQKRELGTSCFMIPLQVLVTLARKGNVILMYGDH